MADPGIERNNALKKGVVGQLTHYQKRVDAEVFPMIGVPREVSGMTSTKRSATEKKLVVLNPRGSPPPIPMASMAARSGSLAGRTVYFVDVRFMNGDLLLKEMEKAFLEAHPEARTAFRQKRGGYAEDDPQLWDEIRASNGLMVMAIGH